MSSLREEAGKSLKGHPRFIFPVNMRSVAAALSNCLTQAAASLLPVVRLAASQLPSTQAIGGSVRRVIVTWMPCLGRRVIVGITSTEQSGTTRI